MSQRSFALNPAASYAAEDWIVTQSNAEAYQFIMSPPDELPSTLLALYGAKGVGKTHLAHIWGQSVDAQFIAPSDLTKRDSADLLGEHRYHVIEDIDALNAEQHTALFHLLNEVRQRGTTLLITANQHPTKLTIDLPDLASRLSGFTAVGIDAPDDMLLEAFIMKQFSDKQLKISTEVVRYILGRATRSCKEIMELVERLDASSLEQKRNITVPFVRDIMRDS